MDWERAAVVEREREQVPALPLSGFLSVSGSLSRSNHTTLPVNCIKHIFQATGSGAHGHRKWHGEDSLRLTAPKTVRAPPGKPWDFEESTNKQNANT